MKNNKHILRIALLSTVFALGISTVTFLTATHKEVDATQYIGNYSPYTYSGDYYDGFDFNATGGMNGTLRTELTKKIKPQGFYTYSGGGADHLSGVLQDADQDPTNSNNMITFYTRDSIPKTAATVNGKVIWNREHVWCQSLSNGNWGESQGGTDILHLRPTYASPNSTRNNHKYGDNTNGTAKTYEGKLYGWLEGDFFEPLDCVKGDAARIVMYVWTTYTGWSGYNPLNITNVIRDYDTLLRWHTLDKPDALEGNRNNYSETSKQKNRNPFVDHPELAWKIFGDMASSSVKNDCMATYPANGSGQQIDPTGIELNKDAATVQVGKTTQLRATLEPAGAVGTVTWTSNNPSIASVDSNGLVTGNAIGSTTITATVGNYSDTCTITVNEVVNNYGTLENPLNISDALEVLYDAGDSLTTEKIYVRGIVSSNTAFNTQYSNYDSIWLQSDDGEDAQALQLYRAKLDNSITNTYRDEDSLVGAEVVVYGYGQKYNDIYELAPKNNSNNPLILSVTTPVQTTISLDQTIAEVEVGNTVTLNATLTPENPYAQLVWETSDETVATVNGGVVTGIGVGTATITASVSQNISAQCTVNVTGPLQYTKVASYDFSSGNSSTSEYNISTLLSRFNSSVVTGQNLSNIVASVTETSKTYAGYANYYNFGLKLGTSSNNGSFTLSLSKDVSRVVVKTAGWGTGDTLTVGDATGQIPGVAYDGSNPIKALTYDITESDNVTFSYAKRGFIQSIDFYSSEEVEDVPINYLSTNNTFATIYGVESSSEQEGTASFVFSQMGYDNGAAFSEDQVEDVTVTANKANGSTTPAYYSTGTALRLYGGNTLTLTAPTNITSIQFTINYGDDSRLSSNVGTYASSAWTGESNSVTFTMSGTSGHIRIQTIAVTYTKSVPTVATPYLRFGTTISKTNWDAIAAKWSIDNCGVMLVKETTLQNTYHEDSIADAYNHDKNLAINYVNLSLLPSYDESNYMISVRIDMTEEAYRGITYCASPFIVIDDIYYFLGEIHSSFNDTLDDCIDHDGKSELSHDALLSLKTNQN